MQIVAEKGIQDTLARMYESLAPENVTLVDIESTYEPGDMRQSCRGLNEALKVVADGNPIVMLGWQTPLAYASRREWHGAMAYPHVAFLRHPASTGEVSAAIAEAARGARPIDQLAIALLTVEAPENRMGVLHHDLNSAMRDDGRRAEWLVRARKHLGDHTDDDSSAWCKHRSSPSLARSLGRASPMSALTYRERSSMTTVIFVQTWFRRCGSYRRADRSPFGLLDSPTS